MNDVKGVDCSRRMMQVQVADLAHAKIKLEPECKTNLSVFNGSSAEIFGGTPTGGVASSFVRIAQHAPVERPKCSQVALIRPHTSTG